MANKVDDVFGINRKIPLNYVQRHGVDDAFVSSLARDRHIVIYGSSKQGKTSLRKKHLKDDQYILVSCQSKWTSETLMLSILKQAGFEVKISEDKAISGAHKVNVTLNAEGAIWALAKAKGEANYNYEIPEQMAKFQPLALDPLDVNDVISAFAAVGFDKLIILEDFHYLPQEVQSEFSFILKAFHENSDHVFVIIGVWREENRLIGFNGDLLDRVQSINADKWTVEQLRDVATNGANLLNVQFQAEFIDEVIAKSVQSVHILQEACRAACLDDGIDIEVEGPPRKLSATIEQARAFVQEQIDGQSGRFSGALRNICDGFQETDLNIPKWIIFALLCFDIDQLEKGVRLRSLSRVMKSRHPKGVDLNNGSITQTLQAMGSLQNKKSVRPLIFDYDATNKTIFTVDNAFLVWLKSQDRNDLAEELDMCELLSSEELQKVIE